MALEEVTLAQLAEEIRSRAALVAEFGAAWCEPCRRIEPALAQFSEDYGGTVYFVKIDIDKELPEELQKYDIRGVPRIKLYRSGKLIKDFGPLSKLEILHLINEAFA